MALNVTSIADTAAQLQDHFISWAAQYEPVRWLRLLAIVGGYIIFRPYLAKLGHKKQNAEFEKPVEGAQISPNALRGQVDETPAAPADAVAASTATAGSKARRRQKVVAKKLMNDEDARLWAQEEDGEDYAKFFPPAPQE